MSNEFTGYQTIGLSILLATEALTHALSEFFDVDQSRILANTTGDWWAKDHSEYDLVVDVRESKGDFPTILELNLFGSALSIPSNLSQVGQLCELLKCNGIVEDITSLNPYRWTVVYESRYHQNVLVDHERLDDKGEFIVTEHISPEEYDKKM
jgi:hypothetical protein